MSTSTENSVKETNHSHFKAPLGKWIRFAIWGIISILFTLWTNSIWWLLALPFFFDLFITRFFPWGFWKSFENKTLRGVMDWVDAIIFALVAVYIINIYFFQNYQIPSSSLEKSLLVGDFLFVSKLSYGPRVPNTPISFPLAQHTMPLLNTKSYLDKPHWDYKRVKGFGSVKRNDIVVFNFPAGDTVAVKLPNPDFHSTCYSIAREYSISETEASQYVRSHPDDFGEVIYRPVDRRENYVKRCVGLPGETLQIIDNKLLMDGKIIQDVPGVQYNYYVQTKGSYISDRQFKNWNISKDDRSLLPENSFYTTYLPFRKDNNGRINPVYLLPLTRETLEKVKQNPSIDHVIIEKDTLAGYNLGGTTYPLDARNTWTPDNYGPLWIPKKGVTISLNEENLMLYKRVIRNYEDQPLEVRNGKAYINGKEVTEYTFKLDYYWMMGDNRHNSADSRAWGFVPEDHIVGKPVLIWLSLDKDRKLFDGKIRWNRLFRKASQ